MKLHVWLAAAALTLLAACETRSYPIYPTRDAGGGEAQARPDALTGADLRPGTNPDGRDERDGPGDARARTDGCVAAAELCNGEDDDCDGVTDDGFEFNTDPQNCGVCGRACSYANAAGLCSAAKCKLADCAAGFVDLDRLDVNGCECQLTNAGNEACDGKDNDCDGLTDEGFDLDSDAANCGLCGRACNYANAAASCVAGKCLQGACAPGFLDLDGRPQSGCEYACAPTNGGVEVCDTKDNDCDGTVDEEDTRVGTRCFPDGLVGCDVATGVCAGGCALGTWACLPGGLTCQGARLPVADACDGLDNDCDGAVDEDFDFANDPRWCGGCNIRCELPNAVAGCTNAACVVGFCRPGFVDLDRQTGNGCEYACTRDGPEVCDGKDNDCDGSTDDADPDLLAPQKNFCVQVGECGKGPGGSARYPERTFPVCSVAPGATRPDWVCNYPDTVQLFATNQVLGQETWCDGLDNDCDGAVDEHATPPVGGPCTDTGAGECRKAGVLRCQADRTLAPACDVSAAPTYVPTDEACNGRDDDCDGVTDESWDNAGDAGLPTCGGAACRGVRDDVVHVTAGGNDYWIYAAEASRVDATAAAQGASELRACARATGAMPWTSVTIAQARAACAGAGMRLCTTARSATCSSGVVVADEWGFACRAGLTCTDGGSQSYPYGCSYAAAACNGLDQGQGRALASGALAACSTGDLDVTVAGVQPASDMSGNVAEWTEDCRGTIDDGTGRKLYTLRGGAYDNIAAGLRCDFMSLVVAEDFAFPTTGFRCCSSCAPGFAECGGACVALATDAANCGACGNVCAQGQTCANGRCR